MNTLLTPENNESVQHDIEQVQRSSMGTVLLIVAVPATAWVLFCPWDEPSPHITSEAWYGMLVLWIGILVAWAFSAKRALVASGVFVSAFYVAIVLLTLGTGMQAAPYGYVILVLTTSAILSPHAVAVISVMSVATLVYIGRLVFNISMFSIEFIGPSTAILISTAVSLLLVYNLRNSLAWVSTSLSEAWQQAELARSRSGDLMRALKALDESSYRIERLNHQLQLALEAAREAEELKSRFAANVSHELRTPLNLIVGFSGLIFEHPETYNVNFTARCLHDLSIIYRNALQLQSLVNDVLDLSQIQAVRMAIRMEPVDIHALIHEVIDMTQGLVQGKEIDFVADVPTKLPVISADRTRVRQVLINLLNNAVRFTEAGYIKLQAQIHQGMLVFSVEDTGVGIPNEELPNLFKEFHQIGSSLSRRCGGTGLGLAISKAFVELHGGQIWAESEVGKGSTFRFSLPADDQHETASMGLVTSRASRSKQHPVVVVLTHSERALRVLQSALIGWHVVLAQNLNHARSLVNEFSPQWMIVDRESVPIEESEAVRSKLSSYHLPVLLSELPQDIKGPIDPMVRGFIVKPVSSKELYDVMRQFGPTIERVLVVDDDRDFAQLIAHLLTLPPRIYQVFRAHSGKDALALARQHPPDVIILDLDLPDIRGEEVMKCIHQETKLRDIPIIIITGQIENNLQNECIATDVTIIPDPDSGASHLLQYIQRVIGPADYVASGSTRK